MLVEQPVNLSYIQAMHLSYIQSMHLSYIYIQAMQRQNVPVVGHSACKSDKPVRQRVIQVVGTAHIEEAEGLTINCSTTGGPKPERPDPHNP